MSQHRRHLTHQERLVREITHRAGDIEAEMNDLRHLWKDWDVPRIERLVARVERVLQYAKTGLNSPTNVGEYNTVWGIVTKVNSHWLEAYEYSRRRRRLEIAESCPLEE